jgi:AcrR family transcriptional regulator
VTRAYRSPVRQEQMELTRERILAAFVEELAEAGDDFPIRRVAARAGVSVRTVYQHFPNREAQIDAVAAWIDAQAGPDRLPGSAAELPAYARERYDNFFANERILRAQLAAGVASQVRRRRRRKREAAIDASVAATGVPAEVARRAAAMVKALIGAPFALQMMDEYGLDREETMRAGEWTVRLIVEALRRR